MNRRGEKRSADVAKPRAGSDCRPLDEQAESGRPVGQWDAPATIEISDKDYRTLHLPCDTLEENGGAEPGR